MNDKEIFKKVGAILSEISDQYQYLSQHPGSVNEFEIELMLANARFLGDHVEILQRYYHSAAASANDVKQDQPEPVPVPEKEHPPIAEEVSAEAEVAPAAEPEPEELPLAEEPANSVEEPAPEPEQDPVIASAPPEAAQVINKVEISERTVAISEPPVSAAKTLNEQMGKTRSAAPTVADTVGRRPLNDLKSAISLNDKLLFVKDLFSGYSLAYSEAIDLLNRSANFEAAKNFLETNYAAKNNWNAKLETRDKFYDILRQRFGA
jgi:hypothetical protein